MSKTRILIVEDEGIVALDIETRLESLGYAVCGVASTGEQAIQLAESTEPALVLMDIKLKGPMDGVDAAQQIRERLDVPIVYLTAFADKHTLERAKVTQPFGYVLKPFQERELHTVIEIAIFKHQMEARLRENEEWLSTTLRSIGDAVIATGGRSQIRLMNSEAEVLTGWKEREALGKPLDQVLKLLDESTRQSVDISASNIFRDDAGALPAERLLLVTKDGAETPTNCNFSLIQDLNARPVGIVLVLRNTSRERQLEREFLKIQKLESLSVLAGGIAHDFNNIITGILGNIEMAKELIEPESRASLLLAAAAESSLRAKNLTQQLLTFAQGGSPIKETVDMSTLVQEVASFALRGSNVCCHFSIASDLWATAADPGQIGQVISNLVINADQAMPNGGTIQIHCDNVSVGQGADLLVRPGKYVRILVIDQGIGIPQQHITRIFDPYFSTKQKGSGLGLAVAYSVVKSHGGYIKVDSELGEGTTFHVYLPAEEKQMTSTTEPALQAPSQDHARVLVMDDEKAVREVVGIALESVGYQVAFAHDGNEALKMYEQANQAGKPYDVVIVDLTVPGGMGGEETFSHLVGINPDVKVIVSSGYAGGPILSEFQKYGFKGLLRKPYRIKQLRELVARVVSSE